MRWKYHLVEKRDMNPAASQGDKLFYGQVRCCNEITFQMVCDKISLCSSITAGDVKNVLSSLTEVLKDELRMGHVVQLGELGRFRLGVGSRGVKTEKEFNTSFFKKAHIIFTPSVILKDIISRVTFERSYNFKNSNVLEEIEEEEEFG